ncbi:hypothetical protein BFG05_03315 [Campylobacter pinnipediorum subsp. pinnipediorum]|uniref:calcium-binding protein n=1 Tax=Campylobacter pinnipediorum TaxID=1965231 RepID=UPI0009CD749B|nr:calcium-binding protein [Campylobacter pinnipediorum]OPA78251.1 hypothetical protein BFG05_03315 [Campylobacter pinnipediorum subsp. pinnipediorum]
MLENFTTRAKDKELLTEYLTTLSKDTSIKFFTSSGTKNDEALIGRNDNDNPYGNEDSDGDNDTIKFKEGISRNDLIFIDNSQNSLIIKIKYTTDSITIQEIFRYKDNRKGINKIELSEGNFISSTQINKVTKQLKSYTQDNGLTSITQNDIQNNQDMMQIGMNR